MKTGPDITPRIPEEILQRMEAKGISRRDFIKFCTATTAALALPVISLAANFRKYCFNRGAWDNTL